MKLFPRSKLEPKSKNPEPREIKPRSNTLVSPGIIRRPLLSEKASILGEERRAYIFEVVSRSTKPAIKKAVEQTFGVKVEKVNIINKKPKRRLWRGKVGRTGGLKKAIVKLAAGEKIEILPK